MSLFKKIFNLFKSEEEIFVDNCQYSGVFDSKQIERLRTCLECGLSISQLMLCANPKFSPEQIQEIRLGFCHNLSYKKVSFYADSKFDYKQMKQIREDLQYGLSIDNIKFYMNPEFNTGQMEQIRSGFYYKLHISDIEFYANTKFSAEEMYEIRLFLKSGIDDYEKDFLLYESGAINIKKLKKHRILYGLATHFSPLFLQEIELENRFSVDNLYDYLKTLSPNVIEKLFDIRDSIHSRQMLLRTIEELKNN